MNKYRRAMHFDFHTMPNIDGLFGNFNAQDFAKKLSDNHVEAINFTARCNIGFSYYDTKVGKKYPGLTRDVLKEVVDACHQFGIAVTAYINMGLNHEGCADHLEWCKIDKDGRIYKEDKKNNFFRNVCYNSSYTDHFIEEIKEIVSYDIDGVFCDCLVTRECYCPKCIEKMKEQGIDINDNEKVLKYQDTLKRQIARKVKEVALGVAKKDIGVYFNSMPWDENIHTHGEVECLSSSVTWGYDYFYAAAPYARSRFNNLLFMSGRFKNDWGDFGGIMHYAGFQNDLYDAMMGAYGLSFGDHLHPIDGLEDEVISRVGKVFEEKMLYEPYTDGAKLINEVGVLAHCDDYDAPFYLQGAARLLCELKIPYNIYNINGDFSSLKLLIIGIDADVDEKGVEKIKDFVKNGGKIIFSGDGINLAKKCGLCSYVEVVGDDSGDNAYYVTPESNMRWSVYRPKKLIKNVSGVEHAKYVDKMFNLHFDGRQTYFYRPQGKLTDYSVAVSGENTAIVSFDLLLAYAENYLTEHKLLAKKLIDILLPKKFVETKGLPQSTIISVTENPQARYFHVKSTFAERRGGRGVIEDHVLISGGTVSIEGEYKVVTIPDLKPIEYKHENGRTEFSTGQVLGYKAFALMK